MRTISTHIKSENITGLIHLYFWFRNQSTQEILEEMDGTGIPAPSKRMDIAPGLQGYYVHRLLDKLKELIENYFNTYQE